MWYSITSTVHQRLSHGAHSEEKKTTFLSVDAIKINCFYLTSTFTLLLLILPSPSLLFSLSSSSSCESLSLRNSERFRRAPFSHRFAAIWLVRIRWVASWWKTRTLTQCMWQWERTRKRRINCCIGRLRISLARMFVFFIFTDLTPSIRSVSFSSIMPFK